MSFKQKLTELNACFEATKWAGQKTLAEIWATCQRGDWMLWLAASAHGVDMRLLVAAKAACAEFARPYMKDPRSIAALDAAHSFGRGECSAESLSVARAAARAAANAADAADAAYDAAYDPAYDAAANADNAAYAAANASYAAANASYAAYAADANAAYSAKKETLRKCADEVRRIIPVEKLGFEP